MYFVYFVYFVYTHSAYSFYQSTRRLATPFKRGSDTHPAAARVQRTATIRLTDFFSSLASLSRVSVSFKRRV